MTADKDKGSPATSEIVIPKEKAVFWLDANGYWRNAGGRFRHKKISDYFHAAIRKDAGGYFLYQQRGDGAEKVYFPFEDTAIFVFDVAIRDDHLFLTFNTGEETVLNPQNLFVQHDNLYLSRDGDRIKFSERSLLKISDLLEVRNDHYFFRWRGREFKIELR